MMANIRPTPVKALEIIAKTICLIKLVVAPSDLDGEMMLLKDKTSKIYLHQEKGHENKSDQQAVSSIDTKLISAHRGPVRNSVHGLIRVAIIDVILNKSKTFCHYF